MSDDNKFRESGFLMTDGAIPGFRVFLSLAKEVPR